MATIHERAAAITARETLALKLASRRGGVSIVEFMDRAGITWALARFILKRFEQEGLVTSETDASRVQRPPFGRPPLVFRLTKS